MKKNKKNQKDLDSGNIIMMYLIVVILMLLLGSVIYLLTGNSVINQETTTTTTSIKDEIDNSGKDANSETLENDKIKLNANGKEIVLDVEYRAIENEDNKINLVFAVLYNGNIIQKLNSGIYIDKVTMYDKYDLIKSMDYNLIDLFNVITREDGIEYITITDKYSVVNQKTTTIYNEELQYVDSIIE